jgi:SAM-dependent methyltransferase
MASLNLAELHRSRGQLIEAASLYELVLTQAPNNLIAHRGLLQTYAGQRRHVDVVRTALAGLKYYPADPIILRGIVEALQTVSPVPFMPAIRDVLLTACADETFDAQQLAGPLGEIISSVPEIHPLIDAARARQDPFSTGVALPTTLVEEPAVLAGLGRLVICSPDLERMLTTLRRFALQYAMSVTPSSLAAVPLPRPFVVALARAAFLVEYAWYVEPVEAALVARLRDALQRSIDELAPDAASVSPEIEDGLLLAALYDSLDTVAGAERLATLPPACWSADLQTLIREQLVELGEERTIADGLPTLTPIGDEVSQVVRAMYEQNPYPRWRAARSHGEEPLADRFRRVCPGEPVPAWPTPVPVLVAGAGTGEQAIRAALRLPEADVLAVDLSRRSLAYGARMAAKLGITNLRFAQADILALDVLEERFALIECGGVLHHLDDPLAGWAVLRRLLRPDGLMFIALYSEVARSGVVAVRNLLAERGLRPTRDGIQAARRLILDLPPDHPIVSGQRFSPASYWDFYSASGFRDLAMHVQEHRFTIPRIAESLDQLGLRFLGFQVPPSVRQQFESRFPAPEQWLDLACWNQFEAEHPNTFISMYQFWCRPI